MSYYRPLSQIPQAVRVINDSSLFFIALEAKRTLLKSQQTLLGGSASCSQVAPCGGLLWGMGPGNTVEPVSKDTSLATESLPSNTPPPSCHTFYIDLGVSGIPAYDF